MSNELNKMGGFLGSVTRTDFGPNVRVDDLTSYVHKAQEGGYWAEVPALPGCVTQGETLDEVVDNLNDAIEGWLSVQTLDSLKAKGVQFTVLPEAEAGSSPAHWPRVRTLELAA